ncbi:mandelate racemase/muconate lactonizing enzyme family protein [Microbacterium aquimaris]|uniref:mandelate racemase/muconate lactonizing enzyme family protein n=1 Tax=Microbacterium aquimaris TaxID=459816 RepID=UPI002AD594AF|nr:mandelate racemase/muconate lactonizing enzyme family protein [Microbacterium aquimaris]MDZ8275273.1 mandelate racemase/muconate lactonizing enzyme family protein [Microbacterium aquimaris]
MRITAVVSHVLQYTLDEELGYSQQYYSGRTTHLVEVRTDEGLVGWGECFGPGNVALANKVIVEKVIAPMIVGSDPLDREVLWHRVYNLLRDHGQKGMPIQALSGVDIALWDLFGKITGRSLAQLVGGAFRQSVPVYGYGMMLTRGAGLAERMAEEVVGIREAGYAATKMKVGLGARDDIALVSAVRGAVGDDFPVMVDANHCYDVDDALRVGRALGELGVAWFEEPVAPEDRDGYKRLRDTLDVSIAGGEAEFTRWGWRDLLDAQCVDIAQPEVCALGGISEYLKVRTLAHSRFVPIVNHVWGSALAVAVNIHLLVAMPDLPGGMFARQPMLELDTTPNLFRDELLTAPLGLQAAIRETGRVQAPTGPGIGVEPDPDFVARFEVSS